MSYWKTFNVKRCLLHCFRLALDQLLEDTENMAPCMAFFSFAMGCVNVPLNILLIAGACWRKPCLIMPWIVITFLEHLIVGVPLIVFIGLISLYLAAQLQLYILATVLIVSIITLFLLSLSSWVSLVNLKIEHHTKKLFIIRRDLELHFDFKIKEFHACFYSLPSIPATPCSTMNDITMTTRMEEDLMIIPIANPLNLS